MKVALVHDWLVNYGGAERVLEAFLEIFPDAHIYTLVYDEKNMSSIFKKEKIHTSFIHKLPFSSKIYTKLLPLMPYAIEELDFSNFDLVISSSSCCAKGIITPPNVPHISYIHSPMRYSWDLYHDYKKNSNLFTKIFMSLFMKNLRIWDYTSSQRINKVISNSNYIKKRIQKYWNIDSQTIYPPVNISNLSPNGKKSEDFYIVFSRFVKYKRIDLAIEACKQLNKNLIVIGDGEERESLKKLAFSNNLNSNNITFTGRISDSEVRDYLQRCRALIFCAEEDFGIIPLEAQGCGRPVIAFGKGGALETIIENETGIFFKEQNVSSLIEAIEKFEKLTFNTETIVNNATKFSKERFKKEILSLVGEYI